MDKFMDKFSATLLQCQLHEAYYNACVSNYQEEVDKMSDEEWAVDLKDYDASFEFWDLTDIEEAIRTYRSK